MYETDWELAEDGPRNRKLTETERLERIAYDLSAGLDVSDKLGHRLVRVLARLPKRVAEYAIRRCVFLEALPYGQVLPGLIVTRKSGGKPRWIVLFSHWLPSKHADGIIAHEIAHAWCRHNRYALDITAECEVEASNLAKAWGFDGIGTDPKHHAWAQKRQITVARPAGTRRVVWLATIGACSHREDCFGIPAGRVAVHRHYRWPVSHRPRHHALVLPHQRDGCTPY